MDIMDLSNYLSERKLLIENALESRLPLVDTEPRLVHEAMRHAVLNGGKRLRPIITLAVQDLAPNRFDTAEPILDLACAIEFVHAASLILDDLPCMDDARERRGRPCTHLQYGTATALLAVISLIGKAFALTSHGAAQGPPKACCAAVQRLAQALGATGLVYGQHLDLQFTGKSPDLEDLEQIHRYKAGALFEAAVELPALALGLDSAQRDALLRFARNLGLAFQLTDDLLDTGNPSEDAGKGTFSACLGRDGARRRLDGLIQVAKDALSCFGKSAAPLRGITDYVGTRTL
jgi:geranylgeranyl pyrophosphate synthase